MTFELSGTNGCSSSTLHRQCSPEDALPSSSTAQTVETPADAGFDSQTRRPTGVGAMLRSSRSLFVAPLAARCRQLTRRGISLLPMRLRLHCLTVFVCLLCMSCGPAAIFTNSHVMKKLKFEYPLTITAIGLGTSACAMHFLVLLGFCSPQPLRSEVYWREVVPVGALSACTFVLGNASYLYLSISLIQVLKSLTPVFTLLVSLLDSPEEVTTALSLSVVVMTIGGGSAVFRSTPGSIHLWGLTLMLLSDLCEAVRTVAQQNLFRKASMSLLEALYWYSPVAFFWTLLGVCALEVPQFSSESLDACISNPGSFLLVAFLGLCVNVSAFWVIQLTSALTLKVLVTVSSALVVVVSSVWLGDTLEDEQQTGYAIALTGFIWYQYEKYKISMSKGPMSPSSHSEALSKATVVDQKVVRGGGMSESCRWCLGAYLSFMTTVRLTVSSLCRPRVKTPSEDASSP